ncbi:ATP-binding protein [Sulfurirhabdus autotrophica]|uniref:histidine kinase n=1 Tax=Sulfurirhabdus autotrophica TaxID=1706046 RepID=A0A4V2W1R1_9PROT|nr:ATP-binding protein [Sulfurirhabdus autotrophica]TCV85159.1 two-component system sensor histidine kinase RegB [Sulfurirhabdus autotrophica]
MILINRQVPAAINLHRLFVLRNIEIAGQVLAILVAHFFLAISLPLTAMSIIIGGLALINLLTWQRLKRPWSTTDLELFGQLTIDVIVLALLVYLSGGSTNPFISLFLLPLTLAAATLPLSYTAAMATITISCYSLLMFYYVPFGHPFPDPSLPGNIISRAPSAAHMHHTGGETFSLHVLGMWFNYAISAVLVSFFVVKMAATLRERDQLLANAREETLRNERIVAMGTLAAGAAHELGTPLSTMAVVTNELQREYKNDPELSENLQILRDQVANCKQILSNLLASSGQVRAEGGNSLPVNTYLSELVDKWQILRPKTEIAINWGGTQPTPDIIADQTLSQAIMNLLNNAADASPESLEILGKWDNQTLFVEILDRGPGLSPETMAQAGKPFFTTKAPGQGIGIGLFLANATIERLGGTVELFNREGGGACIRLTLPLAKLATHLI